MLLLSRVYSATLYSRRELHPCPVADRNRWFIVNGAASGNFQKKTISSMPPGDFCSALRSYRILINPQALTSWPCVLRPRPSASCINITGHRNSQQKRILSTIRFAPAFSVISSHFPTFIVRVPCAAPAIVLKCRRAHRATIRQVSSRLRIIQLGMEPRPRDPFGMHGLTAAFPYFSSPPQTC